MARADEFASSKIPASFKATSYTINKPRPKKEFLGSNLYRLILFSRTSIHQRTNARNRKNVIIKYFIDGKAFTNLTFSSIRFMYNFDLR